MIGLLAKLLIKDYKNVGDSQVRRAYGKLCSIVTITLNVLLFGVKYLAGSISGSIAVTADAFNNLSDAGSSFLTLAGFQLAGKKPDPRHPFGHGRMEYLSGLAVSMAILLMAVELGRTSVEKIITPETVEFSLPVLGILILSIGVKIYIFLYNNRLGKRLTSVAMKAAGMDSLSDSVATTVVLISMLISHFTGLNIDGWGGAFVSLFIFYAGIKAARETLHPLLGQAPDPELIDRIATIVMAKEQIVGFHDLVVHDYGPGRLMVSLHGEVPGNGDIYELHDAIDQVEVELKERLGCEAVIHMDPIAVDDEVVSSLRTSLEERVKELDERVTIHDFRLVQGPTHSNLIFDAVIPYELDLGEEEAIARLREIVRHIDDHYHAVITIDRPYTQKSKQY